MTYIKEIFDKLPGLVFISQFSPGYDGEHRFLHKITFKIILQESGAYSLSKLVKAVREADCSVGVTSEAEKRNVKTNAKHLVFHFYVNHNDDLEKINKGIQNDS